MHGSFLHVYLLSDSIEDSFLYWTCLVLVLVFYFQLYPCRYHGLLLSCPHLLFSWFLFQSIDVHHSCSLSQVLQSDLPFHLTLFFSCALRRFYYFLVLANLRCFSLLLPLLYTRVLQVRPDSFSKQCLLYRVHTWRPGHFQRDRGILPRILL